MFKNFRAEVENQLNKRNKHIRSNCSGEYYSRYDDLIELHLGPFAKFLNKFSIITQYTISGLPL